MLRFKDLGLGFSVQISGGEGKLPKCKDLNDFKMFYGPEPSLYP